jgi:hypothetical protein
MSRHLIISLALVIAAGCDTEEPEAVGLETPSQADLEAIADGPPEQAGAERLDLTAAPRPTLANGWNRVCANTLTLKSAPGGAGGYLDTLYNGYWFYKTATDGAWSAGYSHETGKWGWVLSQYLCAA